MTQLLSHTALLEFRDSLHLDSAWYVGSGADIDAWLKQLDEAIDSGEVDARPTWQIEEDEAAERVANLVVAKVMALSAQATQPPLVANDIADVDDPEAAERLATVVVTTVVPSFAAQVAPPPAPAANDVASGVAPVPPLQTPPDLLGAPDAGMTRRAWRAAIKRGELRASKVGREYKATRADYEKYLAAKRVEPSTSRRRKREGDPATSAVDRALASGQLRPTSGRKKR